MSKYWGFFTFSQKSYYEFFDILHDDRAQHRATFVPGVGFKKNNPGISRGLGVKKLGFLTFSWRPYYEFFDILHDDRAQHRARFGAGVRFQRKIIQGLAGD